MSSAEEPTVTPESFSEDTPAARTLGERLVLDLDGYEGPIDVLLELARNQKVDITKISILALADQYLEFVREVGRVRLELAADYLVMAAWLAYLKSRLLLPEPEKDGDEPSGAEMAAALKFQLQRLQAMRDAGQDLVALPLLGRERFKRGEPQALPEVASVVYDVALYDLLRAYGQLQGRRQRHGLRIVSLNLYSVEEAVRRLTRVLGEVPGWHTLSAFLPPDLRDNLALRSALASTLVASLELCRDGKLDLRQDGVFGPIYLRAKETPSQETSESEGGRP
jgi:segregation and condensation protein A